MKETDSPTIHIIIKKVPTTTPTANPPRTSLRECWRRTILLVPRIPASRMVVQSHGMGLSPPIGVAPTLLTDDSRRR